MPARAANHYSVAFEAFLRGKSIPYVNVDQAKQALFAKERLKSFDFVVYSKKGPNILIDLKGRSCVGRAGNKKMTRGFPTWTTQGDVADLAIWEEVFGEGFKGVLTFIYWVEAPKRPMPGMFEFKDRWYLLMGVDLADYRQRMKKRSPKWETVDLARADFKSLARPLETWL
jgi:hypothetical protein